MHAGAYTKLEDTVFLLILQLKTSPSQIAGSWGSTDQPGIRQVNTNLSEAEVWLSGRGQARKVPREAHAHIWPHLDNNENQAEEDLLTIRPEVTRYNCRSEETLSQCWGKLGPLCLSQRSDP